MRKAKYRIIKDGNYFYAQEKRVFWWEIMDLDDYHQGPAAFTTMEEARHWIIEYKLNKEQKDNVSVVWHDG